MPKVNLAGRSHFFVAATVVVLLVAVASGSAAGAAKPSPITLVLRSLDGSGNNLSHQDWGQAGTQYARSAQPNYADGKSAMVSGPSPRAISNRVFNDTGQNIFSENDISQWGWAWGQFIDHDMDLRNETPAESVPMPFDSTDPLESFSNETGQIDFSRTPAAPGTGVTTPRQQVNTLSSFIDASQVYGVTSSRLSWLRADSSPDLMLPHGYLPRADARGNAATAPPMDLMGALTGTPAKAVEAGDVRANENIALTALQTLFAREHNRIADALPSWLGNELRFQIARRVVGAEIQYVTYNEFLPTLGVNLDPYRGYDSHVNASITNEFATVGFRAHSMVHGEFEPTVAAGTYSAAQLASFTSEGITIENNADGTVTLVIPLAVAFGNPDLLQQVGLGPALQSLGEREYNNDEQIDDSMRSVLFEVPKPGVTDPSVCGEPVVNPDCFTDVTDLGADDIQRGRDHGMPSYNALRRAYGLPAVRSFTELTGERTDSFPRGLSCNDPKSLAFVSLEDEHGNTVAIGNPDDATSGVRASTLAARLKCLYGTVDSVDAFVGMVSEKHVAGTEFGPLQLAIWKQQFTALRNGDRFFYATDPALPLIQKTFGISYQQTIAQIIAANHLGTSTGNLFKASN
jgi:Animal haem peroxidase